MSKNSIVVLNKMSNDSATFLDDSSFIALAKRFPRICETSYDREDNKLLQTLFQRSSGLKSFLIPSKKFFRCEKNFDIA